MKTLRSTFLAVLVLTCYSFATGQSKRNGYVSVNDSVKLFFQFYGNGKDTVLIPDGRWISQYLSDYNGKLTLLTFDVRDRGKSSPLKAEKAISIQDNLTDVETIRKYFRIQRVNLIGWSYMGGMSAMYASKHKENMRSLMMMTPMSMTTKSKPVTKTTDFSRYKKDLDDFLAKGGKESDPDYSRLYWRKFLAPAVHDLSKLDDIVARIPHDVDNEKPSNAYPNVMAIFAKLGDWDFTEIAKSISCRTLVIYGASDTIPVESALEWSKFIENSRYLEFSASGHLIFAEEASGWIQTLETFFGGDWPDKSIDPKS